MFSFLKKWRKQPLDKGVLQKAFHDAVMQAEVSAAQKRLTQGADVHHDNDAALKHAVSKEKWDMAAMLIRNGATPAATNTDLMALSVSKANISLGEALVSQGIMPDSSNSPNNALVIVSAKGWQNYAEWLIGIGMDVHVGNERPLAAAVQNQKWDMIDALIDKHGADPAKLGIDLLDLAVRRGRSTLAKKLVARGMELNQTDSDDNALVIVSAKGWLTSVEWLVGEGMDPHIGNERPLAAAVKNQKWDMIDTLIDKHGADPAKLGIDLLDLAVRRGRSTLAKKLVARGMTLNDGNSDDNALVIASAKGWPNFVDWMIAQGMDPHIGNERPLAAAVKNQKWDMIDTLIDKHAADPKKLDTDLLDLAIRNGRSKLGKKLYALGMELNQTDSDDNALVIVSAKGWLTSVEWLVSEGMDPHIGNERPLAAAIENQKWDMIDALIDKHAADPKKLDTDLLDLAIRNGRSKLGKKLVALGMKLNQTDSDDNALVIVSAKGRPSVAKWLIDEGMDIHIGNERPLAAAVENEKWDMIDWLLNRGADPTVLNTDLMDLAVRKGRTKLAEKLKERGLGIDTDNHKDHALIEIAGKGWTTCVKFLLKNGANVHIANDEAIVTAAQNKKWDMVKLLLEHDADATRLIGMDLPEDLKKPVEQSALKASARATTQMRRIRRKSRTPHP